MTDLEKRAKDYANKWLELLHQLAWEHKTDPKPEYIRILEAYKDGATQETALLSQHIIELQKDKGNLTDKVRELEQQIEKMKCCKEEIIKALKETLDYEWLHAHNGKAKYLYLQTVIDIVNEKFKEIKEK